MPETANLKDKVPHSWEQARLMEKDGKLVPSNSPDENALLKARTLLAYLMDKKKLSYEVHNAGTDSMVIICNKDVGCNVGDELMDEMWSVLNSEGSIVEAVVLYTPFAAIHDQPALAFIKADISTNALFNKVWLKSSLDWLRKNPQDRVALDLYINK